VSTATDAPADLVLAFLNTLDVDEGTDELAELDGFRAWVGSHTDLADRSVSEGHRRSAVRLRDALRTAVRGDGLSDPPSVPLRLTLQPDGGASVAGDDPAGVVAAAVAQLAIRGDWERVKICPADDCAWAFYDESRNRSRHWCSMAVCGNRAKARAHRQRVR